MYGELVPVGGGDTIPLLKTTLVVGRRESCDIVLRFSNISSKHCELQVTGGYWYVRDMNSSNGIKVNGTRVEEKRLDPGDILAVSKHRYEIKYNPTELGAVGPPPSEGPMNEILGKSLLERAGLTKRSANPYDGLPKEVSKQRYDPRNNRPGQIKPPGKPL